MEKLSLPEIPTFIYKFFYFTIFSFIWIIWLVFLFDLGIKIETVIITIVILFISIFPFLYYVKVKTIKFDNKNIYIKGLFYTYEIPLEKVDIIDYKLSMFWFVRLLEQIDGRKYFFFLPPQIFMTFYMFHTPNKKGKWTWKNLDMLENYIYKSRQKNSSAGNKG